ncbi:O-fucosyltransferase 2-like isoform X1 [Corylus avellana]|uniref:O-fucosyltransferase 2-like isoform X1 n=1 Tax=Corylus avellana TaxID=13451 RepID=UPI00286B1B6D|nr:O-fucosyltransferase 2-like isoform X1 [Corylus avellana]
MVSGRTRPMASTSTLSDTALESNGKPNEQEPPESDEIGVSDQTGLNKARASSFHARPSSPTSRSRQGSPCHSPRLRPSRLSNDRSHASSFWDLKGLGLGFLWDQKQQLKVKRKATKAWYSRKRVKGLVSLIGLVGLFFLVNWIMLLRLQDHGVDSKAVVSGISGSVSIREKWRKYGKGKRPQKGTYGRMLALAAHALAEGQNKPEPKDLWQEPFVPASAWKPCADQCNWEASEGNNGYIMVTANGGINQQRIAVCNAVVVARLLNSTLVVPRFLYSSVWRDMSQFSDIYQEEHFINYLTPDIRIVKELPEDLRSLDLEAIGSIVTDENIMKEAKPSFYLKKILPILFKNRVVHFFGFGNRLAFDPIPFQLQRLRCRCNFHALQFVPKIQETGALLLQRLRQHDGHPGRLDHYLIGQSAESIKKESNNRAKKASRYLALHLRFEIDMVAHSLCEFGGGEEERQELEAFREIHFPALTLLKKTTKLPSPAELRSEGLCPLTPEEAILMLAALGFKRKAHIFVAGSQIYGGQSRLAALTSLYPNLVTKEKLLSSTELEPFVNFSSQLAALDFIGCTAADAFAMTDSGSQFSSLASGYRMYYGGGKMPTIRPNKRRLATIFLKNSTIEWRVFEQRVRKAVRQTKHVQTRPKARSIYRYPRCKECMCRLD